MSDSQTHVLDEVPQSQVNSETAANDDTEVTIRLGRGQSYSFNVPQTQPIQRQYDPGDGRFFLGLGNDHPPDTALDDDFEPVKTPARSWAHAAARGAYTAVSGLVPSFDLIVDADNEALVQRQMIVDTIADVISAAHKDHLATLTDRTNTAAWAEHTEHPRALWKANVAADATQIGYWEWVDQQQANQGIV